VVMTLGARGAAIASTDGTIFVPSHPVNVVDTTGAGDSFNGALAAALSKGHSLEDAVRRAAGAGALAVTRKLVVPALPTLAELETLLSDRSAL
jgi:ribokinase